VRQKELLIANYKTGFYRRDFLRLTGAAMAAGALAPWDGWKALAQEQGMTPTSGGEIEIAIGQNPVSFDGRNVSAISSFQISWNFYNRLVKFELEGSELKIVGDLAESWEIGDDGSLTFHLHPNVQFHNGETLTAADVAYTFNSINIFTGADVREGTLSSGPFNLFVVYGFLNPINEVQALDDLTVFFPADDNPFAPLLSALASFGGIINEKADKEVNLATDPIGTGPYMLTDSVAGTRWVMEKNPNYFKEGLPYLDKVTWNLLEDDFARVRALESGGFDWISRVPLGLIDVIEGQDALKTSLTPPGGFQWFLSFNTSSGFPYDDVRFRQALVWALDATRLIQLAFFGKALEAQGQAVNSELTDIVPNLNVDNPYALQPNLVRARQLLAEAGVPPGFTVNTWIAAGEANATRVAEVYAETLAQIGINLRINFAQTAERFAHIFGADADFGVQLEPISGFHDHDQGLAPVFATGSFFNEGAWSDPDFDRLIIEGAGATDPAARAAIYEDLYTNHVFPNVPKYHWAWQEVPYAMVANLNGFAPALTQETSFEKVWLDQ
jgi:peptide/nickel transport system substrate-binding protein